MLYQHDWIEWLHMLCTDCMATTWTRTFGYVQKKGFLSTPQSVHACGSTNCLWNRLVGQLLVHFAAPFSRPHLRRLRAACHRQLESTPRASRAQNGLKSIFVPWARQVHSRLAVEAKAIHANPEISAMSHNGKREELSLT